MTSKLGMDPDAVRSRSAALQAQLGVLDTAATAVRRAQLASANPFQFGIMPGGLLLDVASQFAAQSAYSDVISASASASDLIGKALQEVAQQEAVSSGTGRQYADSRHGTVSVTVDQVSTTPANFWTGTGIDVAQDWFKTNVTDYRNRISVPRNLLAGANAIAYYATRPPLMFDTWNSGAARRIPALLKSGADALKIPTWTDKLTMVDKSVTTAISTGFKITGKVFSGLGVVNGVVTLADGLQSGDGWAIADGVIGTVTSLGSFAPPPAGLIFAGVGAAWTAGRWLFGADESGKTGIDHISGVVSAVTDTARDVVDSLWPW